METREQNKMIAEFMGWIHHENPDYDAKEMNNLKYHESWEWLMPVIEEISTYRLAHHDEADRVCQQKIVIGLKPLYEKVIEFITWYNKQAESESTTNDK